jgi:secondary thiamine-phosphate synthase enzyme
LTTFSTQLRLSTEGNGDVVDLTGEVMHAVSASALESGICTVFVPGATAAITTLEHEPGGVHDLQAALDRLIPASGDYEHNRLNHDTNSHAHIRAAIVGPSETIPIEGGRPLLGTWQQVALLDFDDRPRVRTVIVSVVG